MKGVKQSFVSVGSVDLEVEPSLLPQVVVEVIESLGFDATISQLLSPGERYGANKSVEILIRLEGLKTEPEAKRLVSSLRLRFFLLCNLHKTCLSLYIIPDL